MKSCGLVITLRHRAVVAIHSSFGSILQSEPRIPNYTEMNAWTLAGLDIGYIDTSGEYVWPPTRA